MKKILFVVLTFVAMNAVAGDAQILCDLDGDQVDIESNDGYLCADELLGGGDACFKGDVNTAVMILNLPKTRDIFDGTDGEYIKNARAVGKNRILYTTVDEANDVTDQQFISRCK